MRGLAFLVLSVLSLLRADRRAPGYLWHLHSRHGEDMEAEDLGAIVANHEAL